MMLRNLLRTSIASLVLMSGSVSGGAPPQHEYHVDIAGDITASLDSGFQKFTKNTHQVNIKTDAPLSTPFNLGLFWQTAGYSTQIGSNCFPEGEVNGAIQIRESRKDANAAQATFWFHSAFNPTGWTSEGVSVKYVLTLTGGWENPTNFPFPPPTNGDIATMTVTAWEMGTEGKGKHNNLGTACKGMVDNDGIAVVLIVENITPPPP